jgi:hypothetical protein
MAFYRGPRIITDGLVLHLDAKNTKSYPGTGTIWYDRSDSKYNGSLINGPTFNSNGSIIFDGVNDYVDISTNIGTQLVGNFTYNIWAKRNGNNSSTIHGLISNEWHTDFTGVSMALLNNNTSIAIEVGNGTTRPSYSLTSPVSNLNWTNYTLINNTGVFYVYVNGILLDSRSITVLQNSTRQITIGRWAPSYSDYFINGEISIASVYNRAISDSELLQNYNATKTRFGL